MASERIVLYYFQGEPSESPECPNALMVGVKTLRISGLLRVWDIVACIECDCY
jgi:hypothetical protein